MALLLYDNPRSSNALKARFALAELGLAYDTREVPFDQPRPDWYRAVNPVAGIPTLDDDGFIVSESNAIIRYLATREGRDDLYPAAARERAAVDELMERWVATFRPAFFKVEAPALGFVPGRGMDAAPPDEAKAAAARAEIAPTLDQLEGLLDGTGYGVLGRFTLADVTAGPVLWRSLRTGLDLASRPRIAAWRDTVTSRPAFAAAGPVS